jgi:hypothetical protein
MHKGTAEPYQIVVRCKTDRASWQTIIRQHLSFMIENHCGNKRECRGIDVRLSADFVKRELQACDMLVEVWMNDHIVGFSFLKTKSTLCIHVSLMTSFEKGVGKYMVEFLREKHETSHKYLTLQSTDQALGFYLHLGFLLFNQAASDEYISGGDVSLTNALHAELKRRQHGDTRAAHNIRGIRETLLLRLWIVQEQEEWPLLIRRKCVENTSCRRSRRLMNSH